MTDIQLYLAIGIPTLAILIGILINSMQFSHAVSAINARITSLETATNARLDGIDARLTSAETRLDMLISKFMDFDSRLTRLEERLERR